MHNLDRTNPEWGGTMETFQNQEADRFEWELHGSGDAGEAGELMETYETEEFLESPFSESEEMELAAELLEVTNEEELNHFLGKLIRKAGSAIGKVVRSPIGQALGGVLKKVAKTALPMAGAALGNLVVPGIGGVVGGKLASAAGSLFGLELEGLSPEDREFEVARRYVRLAGATARRALSASPRVSPTTAAHSSLKAAARRHAPGLPTAAIASASMTSIPSYPTPSYDGSASAAYAAGHGRTGRWFRRGHRIVLLGAYGIMPSFPLANRMLGLEARSLLTRLAQVRPFALRMPMVPAAALAPATQVAIEQHMDRAARELRVIVQNFLHWLDSPEGGRAPAEESQRRFSLLKLRFNSMLDDFDIFADVISQRSEHETGVWVSGLDVVAADALAMPSVYQAPPVTCYLDRGHGAAIRRARTRLPGGDENPVAIIRVPRERMVGSGIGSSLVHEVGHQGAALLGLVETLRPVLRSLQARGGPAAPAWKLYERWISEIVADLWSVARIGIGSTLGLMGVVSLPRFFVFRTNVDDPHPIPWFRVKLSCAMGQALFPHPQWTRLAALWESYYPARDLTPAQQSLFERLDRTLPEFVSLLVRHRPPSLRGRTLPEALEVGARTPERLRTLWSQWAGRLASMRGAPPCLVFAVVGQARADGEITPEVESRTLSELLTGWALDEALATSAACARPPEQARRRGAPNAPARGDRIPPIPNPSRALAVAAP